MLNYPLLRDWTFPEIVRTYGPRDTILYALGAGCGGEPEDLPFVYERSLVALPTMASVVADAGFWLADPKLGADTPNIVHGAQSITLHAPLPPAATVVGRTRLEKVVDKGKARGAFVHTAQTVHEKETGRLLATLTALTVMRGDGGFGGPTETARERVSAPAGPCDASCTLPVLAQAAMIYRLSGDMNPLHADPEVARQAGFPAPILHGLCTMAVAGRAILKLCCDNDPARLGSIAVRFRAPTYPGEALRTEIWRSGSEVAFRTLAAESGTVVLDGGTATVAG